MADFNCGYIGKRGGLERILCRILVKKNSKKSWVVAVAATMYQPRNHMVKSLIPGSRCQIWGCLLTHTFGTSAGVVPRKQNQEWLTLSETSPGFYVSAI